MAKATSNKKLISKVLLGAFVLVLAVGGTLAYLSTVTEQVTNSFTFLGSTDIDAEIDEGGWSEENAVNLAPGATITKEPTIINTSTATGMSEYVAIQVTFTDNNGNTLSDEQMAELANIIEIDWDTTGAWVTESGNALSGVSPGSTAQTIYYYANALSNVSGNNQTSKLFTTVTIKDSVTNDQLDWINSSTANEEGVTGLSGGFNIVVYGAAVQAEGFDGNVSSTVADPTLAYTELKALFTANTSSSQQ